MILYGVPGIGKTSLAAFIPGIVLAIAQDEDGINRLKEAGLVPEGVPVLPPVANWSDLLDMLEQLRTGEHNYKAIAIDALGSMERLCHEEVCRRDFNNDWTDKGFMGYMRGYETSLSEWRMFINALDKLRDERRTSIMLLGHAKVSPFRNPEGPDYDRYNVDVHNKTWALTHRWADMVLFANYEVAFAAGESTKKKAKAHGGQSRVIYTEHHAAYDAKNRHNLPDEISMGSSGEEAYKNLAAAIKAGRRNGKEGK